MGHATLVRAAYLAIQGGAALAVFAVLARILSPAELGAASAALALSVACQILADLGLSQVVSVEVPAAVEHQRSAVAGAAARLFLRLAVLAAVAVAALAVLLPADAFLAGLYAAPSAAAALGVTGAEAIARATRGGTRPLALVACSRLPFFLLIPVISADPTAETAMLVYSGTTLLGALPAFVDLRRLSTGDDRRHARTLVRTALWLGVTGALIVFATRMNVLVLAALEPLREVARFEASWRVLQPFVYAAGALGTATTPFAARAIAQQAGVRSVVGPGLLAVVAGGAAGAAVLLLAAVPLADVVYGDPDAEVARAIRWLAAALVPSLVGYYLQSALFVPLRRFRLVIASAVAMAVVGIGATIALADHGASGAAAALALSQVAYAAVLGLGLVVGRSNTRAVT